MKIKIKKEYIIEILAWIVFLTLIIGVTFGVKYYYFVKEHTYTLVFQDIDGIIEGSPVRFSGLVIGHVRNVEVKKDRLLVQIIVTKPNLKIPDGTRARVEFTGLAGSKSIEMTPPEEDGLKGIIVESPIRLRDFMDTLEIFSNILQSIQNMLLKLTTENTKEFFEKVKQPRDMTPFQEVLDEALKEERKMGETNKQIIQWEKAVSDMIDRIPKRNTLFKK